MTIIYDFFEKMNLKSLKKNSIVQNLRSLTRILLLQVNASEGKLKKKNKKTAMYYLECYI